MVNQNVAHQLRGYAKKVSPVLPLRRVLANQPQIRFVNQGSALEGVIGPFAAQVAARLPTQLTVDHGNQRFACFLVALAPIGEQPIDSRGGIGAHVATPAGNQVSDVALKSSPPSQAKSTCPATERARIGWGARRRKKIFNPNEPVCRWFPLNRVKARCGLPQATKRIASRKRRTKMKIFNTAQHATSVKLVLGVLIATFAFGATAKAQSTFEGKFVLPHEVRWNHAVLPAGEYSIQIDSTRDPVVLHSTSTNESYFTSVPMMASGEKGAARLNITNLGNESRVRSLNVPAIGKTLIFDPLTKTEKEMLAKAGQNSTVPIITARK
jgi:hypothetical protein